MTMEDLHMTLAAHEAVLEQEAEQRREAAWLQRVAADPLDVPSLQRRAQQEAPPHG